MAAEFHANPTVSVRNTNFPPLFRRHLEVMQNFQCSMKDSFFSCRHPSGYQVSYKATDKQSKYSLAALDRHFDRHHFEKDKIFLKTNARIVYLDPKNHRIPGLIPIRQQKRRCEISVILNFDRPPFSQKLRF